MHESPAEDTLDRAARAALVAEMHHIYHAREVAFVLPAEAQVRRLIAAAWPILTEAGDTSG